MQKSFEFRLQFHKHTKVGDLGDLADNLSTGLVLLGDQGFPWILGQLLQAQCDSLAFLINRQHLARDGIALLEKFVRVRNLAGPAHVADMQQTIDTFFEFDEGTVVRQVADSTADESPWWVLGCNLIPWIRLSLLHTQRDFLLVLVDAEDNHIDFVARIDQFGWVINSLGPGHFADVNEAFDAIFELDERTVGHDVDNFAADTSADGELGFDIVPGAGFFLLQSERDLFLFAIDVQNHDFDFLVDLHHLGWMVDAAPAHVGDVQQTIDTAQVNECTEVGDILDHTTANLTFGDFGQQRLLHLFALQFDQPTT